MARHKATGRYYLTADKSRVVAEGDPEAAFLYCVPGTELDADEAERLGLRAAEKVLTKAARADDDAEAQAAAREKATEAAEKAAEKAAPEDAGVVESTAAEAPAEPEPESKMVERPPQHKAVSGPRARDAKD